ncbi:MAG: tetratricopeptide repeat protein, partial [Bacteroidaceae bacterium]|nr:tetratricopeptide repeat protein [Bacteroidaceae bacterium]
LGHFNRGLLRAQVGDDNRAIEDFNFVLEQEPDNTIALYNRALLLSQTGDYRGAIRDISAVIQEYPEFWAGYRTRAQIRRKIGDVYGAERDEFKVLKAEMEKRTGTYQSKTKTRKKSERNPEDYNKLVEEDTRQPEREEYASEYRGRVQDKQTELTPAPFYVLTYYERGNRVSTAFVPFHRTVESFNQSGQLPLPLRISNAEANASDLRSSQHTDDILAVTEVLSDSPETTGLYLRRAMDYYHVRDFEACLQDLNRAIELQPLVAISYFLRAQVRCAQLQVTAVAESRIAYGQALDDLRRVVELEPDMLYAYYNMGNIYVALNDNERALAAYSQALELNPRFPDAWYNRGIVYLMEGRTEQGLSDLSQAGEYGLYAAYNLIKRYSKGK